MAVVAILLGLAAGGWALTAQRRAADVSSDWALRCPRTVLGTHHHQSVIEARPGWRCEVRLRVVNSGSHPIRVSGVEVPYLGSGGGAEIGGFSTAAATLHDAGREGDHVDGVYDVDVTIPGHAARTVRLPIGWRPHGCNAAGGIVLGHWPTIVLETMHRTFRRAGDQALRLRTYDDPHDATACPD